MQAGYPLRKPDRAVRLFAGLPCLHGIAQAALTGMGRVWADNPIRPRGAVAAVGDFLLCCGRPGREAAQLVRRAMASDDREWLIYAPGGWLDALGQACAYTLDTRYAFHTAPQPEEAHLRRLAALPEGVTVQPIEGEWLSACREEAWSCDFVRAFGSDAAYAAHGLGVLLMADGRPAAGASSYVAYPGGIEVQVQTREGFEGRGLATIASAQLILAAHARGWRVSWDAANPASARIAEKLGFRPAGEYVIASLQK